MVQSIDGQLEAALSRELLWANAVLAVGSGIGSVVYTGSETRSDEHEPFTDKIWTARHGDRPTCQDESYSALLGSARASSCVSEDTVCGVFRAVGRAGCIERVPWILVHVHVPILDFVLVDYPYQVIMNDDQISGTVTVVRTGTLPEELRMVFLFPNSISTFLNGLFRQRWK